MHGRGGSGGGRVPAEGSLRPGRVPAEGSLRLPRMGLEDASWLRKKEESGKDAREKGKKNESLDDILVSRAQQRSGAVASRVKGDDDPGGSVHFEMF